MTGLLGIGLLGTAIAERFLASGFNVIGFDKDLERREALAALGGAVAPSAAEVARDAALVVLSLPDSSAVRGVLDEIEPHLRGGAIVVDTTSGEPGEIAGFAERLANREVHYLDACVCGSSRQVREREAIVMCGGEHSAYVACAPLLAAFARQSFHLGTAGSGARMMMVVSLAQSLKRAVLEEALGFAKAGQLDPRVTLEVLRTVPAAPEARPSQHLQDLRLVLAAGARCGAKLPLTERHCELLESAG